jgi:hypothetical protein
MKPEPCSMALLVEAKRDGRLHDRELSSIDRHLAMCASCASLERDLDHVRALLRSPAPEPTPLEVQRGRLALLRDAALPSAPAVVKGRSGPRLAVALAIVATAALVFGLERRWIAPVNTVTQVVSTSASVPVRTVTTVVPEGAARFVRATDGGTEIVTLEDGAIDLSVRHLSAGERFLVKTGDAEVEVRGTIFRVEARDNRLQNVAVVEGKVEVRFRGGAFLLGADERWDRPAEARTIAPPSVPVIAPTASPRVVVSAKRGAASPRPGASASPPADDAFVEGMGMMERGDYGAAARHLDAFSKSNAGDDRAEDAAFLVILALQRAGRGAEAVAAARRYLGAYPAGYRRAEAQSIVDAP